MWTPRASVLAADDVGPIPVALIVLADRHGADKRQVSVGQAGFFRPGVELLMFIASILWL
jgi:hypothetical protein